MKSLQKEQNSTNVLLWPPICRNKPAITPKWFNSLDTNSSAAVCLTFNGMWTVYLQKFVLMTLEVDTQNPGDSTKLCTTGHSTATWTKFYPILTPSSPWSGQFWTFYMIWWYLVPTLLTWPSVFFILTPSPYLFLST